MIWPYCAANHCRVPGAQAAPPKESVAGLLPGIHLNGINIGIDEDLLIDSPGGVAVENSSLSVSSEENVGGTHADRCRD